MIKDGSSAAGGAGDGGGGKTDDITKMSKKLNGEALDAHGC